MTLKYTRPLVAASLALAAGLANAQLNLVSDLPPGQLPGTSVTWSVENAPANATYRLAVTRIGGQQQVIYDYTSINGLRWTPLEVGRYAVTMTVRDGVNLETLRAGFLIRPTPGVSVRETRHPLVAIYGAPACPAGLRMAVTFSPEGGTQLPVSTDAKACDGNTAMNFYLGGMLPETNYAVRHVLLSPNGTEVVQGPLRQFTTGAIPEGLDDIPEVTVDSPATADVSTEERFVVFGPTAGLGGRPIATDLDGNLVWYYNPPDADESGVTLTRMSSGGRIMLIGAATSNDRFRVREIDLVGNTLRETNARRLSEQFAANGGTVPLTTIHHEARELPNGQWIVLAHSEARIDGAQGEEGPVDILSDIILGLDRNMQVIWQWDAFEHVDLEKVAILGELCTYNPETGATQGGCPILFLSQDDYGPEGPGSEPDGVLEANDWLHSNALGYRESDGTIVMSIRHLDWMMGIDYADGQGTGAVKWNLGKDGDFTLTDGVDPDLWQSHQHDNNFIGDNQMLVYDNGNALTACAADPINGCGSRAQLYSFDENTMEATLEHSLATREYSFALGSAQLLENGNIYANSGIIGFSYALGDELTPSGEVALSLRVSVPVYRQFRVKDLYTRND
ncbi:MAG: aryl-sulfate sulfotransferase [Pseudomonadota bacterium]